ncbi:hypothetical protein BDR06DRAFT_951079 [Suillus hirtellus]|nr:hypothetical protein BDR06DRAFT_951079 [Suillus hirtellus]
MLTKKYGNFQDGMVAKIFWGETSRTNEPDILNKFREIAEVHNHVKDHIPELLWYHRSTNLTFAIREALSVPELTTGSRVLYILIFRKLLPITKSFRGKRFSMFGLQATLLCGRKGSITEVSALQPNVVLERREADSCLKRL